MVAALIGCGLGVLLMMPSDPGVEAKEPMPVAERLSWTAAQTRLADLLELATDLPRLWPESHADELQAALDRADTLLSNPRRTRKLPPADLELTIEQYGLDAVLPIHPDRIAGSGVGIRTNPVSGHVRRHNGQDIGCRRGEPIYAIADGTVRYAIYSGEAGNYVHLDHGTHAGRTVESRYLHLTSRRVRTGDQVKAGQLVGTCGNTGLSTSPHLHFETLVNHRAVSPFMVADFEALHTAWAQATVAPPPAADLPGWVDLNLMGEVTGTNARPLRLAHEVAVYEPWDDVEDLKVVIEPRDESQTLHEQRQAWAEFAHEHRTAVALVVLEPAAWAAPPPGELPIDEDPVLRHGAHLRFVGEVLVPWLDEAYRVRGVHAQPGSPLTVEMLTSTYAHLPACSGDQPSPHCVAFVPAPTGVDAG